MTRPVKLQWKIAKKPDIFDTSMKRDMNLIRSLLLDIEGEEPKPDLSQYSQEQVIYHTALLIEAGLVDGSIVEDATGYPAMTTTTRLKWMGHEFLDAARDEKSWKRALIVIGKAGGSITLPILKQMLTDFLKDKLGMSVEVPEQ